MITEISRQFRFEAAHRLPHVEPTHKCYRLHGHSFRVTIIVRGPIHPQFGWIVDFEALDRAWAPLGEQLDHHYLNEVDGLENPTSELIAQWIWNRFHVEGAEVHAVTVHETCVSACTVYGR